MPEQKCRKNAVLMEIKACYHVANPFEQIGANLARIQAKNLQKCFWQKAPGVNYLRLFIRFPLRGSKVQLHSALL